MAQVTIYKPADIVISVIDGQPPIDQTAEVAALTAQVGALTAAVDSLKAEKAALLAKIATAQAALA